MYIKRNVKTSCAHNVVLIEDERLGLGEEANRYQTCTLHALLTSRELTRKNILDVSGATALRNIW
jgi:hypothetical protein